MWNPTQYLKFANERGRPFFDLVAQVRAEEVASIVDLGCGPGTLTRTLCDRWPKAHVLGVDNSPEMLEQAKSLAIPGRLAFVHGDVATWTPEKPIDLVVSNAVLQWVDHHERVLVHVSKMLSDHGTLAIQLPCRFHGPSYTAIEATAGDPRWSAKLKGVGLHRDSVKPIEWYVQQLHDLGFDVNAWETTYMHVLRGENPILEWMRGTALRPLLSRLEAHEIPEFEKQLAARFSESFPTRNGVTILPFPRLFLVATFRGA
jgi:trans-aconitate 2-methyltransferase